MTFARCVASFVPEVTPVEKLSDTAAVESKKVTEISPYPSEASIARSYEPAYSTRAPQRGTCLIISIDKFDNSLCLPPRNGSAVDVRNVCLAFASLQFEILTKFNVTACEMRAFVKEVAEQDHSQSDCFACVILSHGDENGLVYAQDGAVSLDHLISPFRGDVCSSLKGKPKLFFIQACRGTTLDSGTLLVCDSRSADDADQTPPEAPTLRRIPVEADLFIAYAVQPGYYAFRNSVHGSWFIRALSEALLRYGPVSDLLSIMTRVNHSVAYDFESVAATVAFSGKKQMPSFVSTLTKKVFFPPKNIPYDTVNYST
ncbi:Caspase 3 apoptosis cysteine peptidase b [Fasciolopsis buskii]|uniref:Caspase 3 apoptosis cysteine peptidase b n=1 Tax=Fasciolopsis buskii TaxID=27845 RepID=A0A8E0VNC0_9TREM|nr:Caspase 3 apoptosis cysteine peptidase b [Fasciolopsis buski]